MDLGAVFVSSLRARVPCAHALLRCFSCGQAGHQRLGRGVPSGGRPAGCGTRPLRRNTTKPVDDFWRTIELRNFLFLASRHSIALITSVATRRCLAR